MIQLQTGVALTYLHLVVGVSTCISFTVEVLLQGPLVFTKCLLVLQSLSFIVEHAACHSEKVVVS